MHLTVEQSNSLISQVRLLQERINLAEALIEANPSEILVAIILRRDIKRWKFEAKTIRTMLATIPTVIFI